MTLIQSQLSEKANRFLEIYRVKHSIKSKRIAINTILEEMHDKEGVVI